MLGFGFVRVVLFKSWHFITTCSDVYFFNVICLKFAVVLVLFQHSLIDAQENNVASLDHIFGVAPLKIASPSTNAEVALALRVLEGCCLLHRESTILAHQHKAILVHALMQISYFNLST